MKKIIYLMLLTLLPSTLILADHGHHNLEGLWFDRYGNNDIRIKSNSKGIKFSGVNGRGHWIKFRHSKHRNVFLGQGGSSVEIISPSHIVFVRGGGARGRRASVVHYVRGRDRYSNYCRSDYFRSSSRYVPHRSDGFNRDYNYREDGYEYSYTEPRESRRIRPSDLVGKWIARSADRTVYIKKDGDGIKARFGGSNKWTYYYQDHNRTNVFTDRIGNRYRLKSEDSLEWVSHDGREIKLKRE